MESRRRASSVKHDSVYSYIPFNSFLANVLRYVRYMLSAVRLSVCL